jgi:hypothetical protein
MVGTIAVDWKMGADITSGRPQIFSYLHKRGKVCTTVNYKLCRGHDTAIRAQGTLPQLVLGGQVRSIKDAVRNSIKRPFSNSAAQKALFTDASDVTMGRVVPDESCA